MPYTIYILESTKKRHYIGFTSNLPQRIAQHNRSHKGFTGTIEERWEILISYEVQTKQEARELEKKLKSFKNFQKAFNYLERLKAP